MKKNIVIILVIVAAVGLVAYLLRDRLRGVLGLRVPGEEIPEGVERKTMLGLLKEAAARPSDQLTYFERAAGRWIQPDVVQLVTEIYPKPSVHMGILARLVRYIRGEAEGVGTIMYRLPPTPEEIAVGKGIIEPEPVGLGRYPWVSWALPQR